MSGESYVALGGAAVLIAAAPVVLAGAAVFGVARAAGAAHEAHMAQLVEEYHLQETQIEAINRTIAEINSARCSLASRIKRDVIREVEGRVDFVGFGDLSLKAANERLLDELASEAQQSAEDEAIVVGDPTDLSHLFESDIAVWNAQTMSKEELLSCARERVAGLVALTVADRGAVDRFLQRCKEIEQNQGIGAADARKMLSSDMESVCLRLDEANSAERREAYVGYLSLCGLCNRPPKDLSFDQLLSETEAMVAERLEKNLQQETFRKLVDSLGEVGLTSLGAAEFDGDEGLLVVDEADATCGLFLSYDEGEKDSFLFTTVSSADPSQMSLERRAALQASAEKLCEKKDALFGMVLPGLGIESSLIYEFPASQDTIRGSRAFAEYAKKQESGKSSQATSGWQNNLQEV